MLKLGLYLTVLTLFSLSVAAATITGTIYNEDLEIEKNVLVEIDSIPRQQFLARDGDYRFELPPGDYLLQAAKEGVSSEEEIKIVGDGRFVHDLILFPSFKEEEQMLSETETDYFADLITETSRSWTYALAGAITALLLYRIYRARKKYGPLSLFRKKIKEEGKKTLEEHKEELSQEPGHLEQAMEIINRHEGRITQKELRKEMLYLSEAKVSLIVTELEHQGKIEKIKKGRGNVLLRK